MKKSILKVFMVALFSTPMIQVHAQAWYQKANFSGGNRFESCGFSLNGKGYILTGNPMSNDVWEYDTTANTWSSKNNFGGTAREGAGAASVGGFGYVIGGKDGSGFKADVWKYDPTLDTWTTRTAFPGTARYLAVTVADPVNGKIYYGTGDHGTATYLSDFWAYDPTLDTWTSLAAFPGGQRSFGAGFCLNGQIYVGTGNNNDGTDDASIDFWKYDPGSNTWSSVANVPGYARRDASTFTMGGYGFMCTGLNSTYGPLNDAYVYNPNNNTWTVIANFGGGNSSCGVGFAIGGNGYIGTGLDASNTAFNQFWVYKSTVLAIDEIINKSIATMYPNPTNGILHFSFAYNGDAKEKIIITDMVGKVLESLDEVHISDKQLTLDESNLNAGMYFYQVIVNDKMIGSGKFIIAR